MYHQYYKAAFKRFQVCSFLFAYDIIFATGFFFNMTLYTGDAMVYVLQTTSIKIAFVVKHNIMFTDSLQYSLHIKIRHR